MELEPISDLKTAFGFSHRAGWCRSEKARFASPADGSFRDVHEDLWTADGTLYTPEVEELAQHTNT